MSVERKLFSGFGSILDQRYQELDGFKRSFTTMTKADFARVIDDVSGYMMQKTSILLISLLGHRCTGYK